MIYTKFNTPKRIPTPSGTQYLNTYSETYDKKTGTKKLERSGSTNVYEIIQASAESVRIENILQAVAMGDLSVLKAREATYIDATTMPKSLREAQEIVIKAKDEFYKMPLEVRKEFGNDPDRYVAEMGTREFLEKMAPYNDKINAISKEKSDAEYRKKVKEAAKFNADVAAETKSMKGDNAE